MARKKVAPPPIRKAVITVTEPEPFGLWFARLEGAPDSTVSCGNTIAKAVDGLFRNLVTLGVEMALDQTRRR